MNEQVSGYIIYYFAFFQVTGEKRTIIGKSSSLPASISIIKTILDGKLKNSKFLVGPSASSPGPILLKQATTPEKQVVILQFSNIDKNKVEIIRKAT